MTFELVNSIPLHHDTRTKILETGRGTQLLLVKNFFTPEQCEELIEIGSEYLEPSRVGGPNDTTMINRNTRSSFTTMLSDVSQHPAVIEAISQIDKTYGHPHLNSNPLQLNRYRVGEEFKAHYDYHDPVLQAARIEREGQRTWTFLIYLNEDFEGGTTDFPELKYSIVPERGMLVAWNNLLPDGSPNAETLHASTPVMSGTKYMMTKWFKNKVI